MLFLNSYNWPQRASSSLIEGAGGPMKKFVSDDVDLAAISDLL